MRNSGKTAPQCGHATPAPAYQSAAPRPVTGRPGNSAGLPRPARKDSGVSGRLWQPPGLSNRMVVRRRACQGQTVSDAGGRVWFSAHVLPLASRGYPGYELFGSATLFAHAAVTDVQGKKLWHDQRIARMRLRTWPDRRERTWPSNWRLVVRPRGRQMLRRGAGVRLH